MDGVGNLVDLLLFYTRERMLFNRMVGPMGKSPRLVKMALAFWLLLEEIGYRDLTRKIHSFDGCTIEAIFNETISCLDDCIIQLQPDDGKERRRINGFGATDDDSPVFVGILDEPLISRRFFHYNSEFMFRRFTHIMDTVCDRIFGENAAIEVDHHDHGSVRFRPFGDQGSSGNPSTTTSLNPAASEFVPGRVRMNINEDSRTMFLTFSKGYPLTRHEVINFFTSKWGDVVEEVVVEESGGGGEQPPLYGRVRFTQNSIIQTILNGQSKAKFMVGRKHLWARIYVPRRT